MHYRFVCSKVKAEKFFFISSKIVCAALLDLPWL